jgi:uncharacterized YccA/Bax inhibitor family protein
MRIRSSNPAMRVFENYAPVATGEAMTVQGTVNKTGILFLLTLLTATITWRMAAVGNILASTLMWVGLLGGLGTSLFIIFSKTKQNVHILAPIYALFEGLLLGAISAFFNKLYGGIVIQAVFLTFGVFIGMLLLYKFKILQATPGFVKMMTIAIFGILLFYVVSFFLRLAGINISTAEMGIWGLVIQIFIVGIASLSLILDFNMIEQGAVQGLPKKMEWYGAFSLMVTLIWLYLEILRLLAILRR